MKNHIQVDQIQHHIRGLNLWRETVFANFQRNGYLLFYDDGGFIHGTSPSKRTTHDCSGFMLDRWISKYNDITRKIKALKESYE